MEPVTTKPVTKKPCIDICEFNKKDICKACGRTRQEKKEWKRLSDDEKQAICQRILVSHGSGKGKQPSALRELYEKARLGKGKKQKNGKKG